MTHIFLSFLLFNIILFIFYTHYRRGHYFIDKKHLVFYTILLIAFGTYGTGEGDYLHYRESVEIIQSMFDVAYYNGMEVQYNYLAYLCGGNYTLWRLVLFSVQFIGMSWLLYKAKLNTYPIFLCFIAICLILYTYQRSYWGVIFYFIGLYLMIEKKNPLFVIVIILCYFSHTQNVVLLTLLPLAFIDIRKWHILAVILLLGTIVTIVKDTFNSILDSGGIEGAEYAYGKMERYNKSDIGNFGNSIGETLLFVLRYVPMAFVFMTWLVVIFNKRNKYIALYKPYRRVLNVMIGVVISSIIVLLADFGGGTFFYRIIAMACFPLAMLLPYMMTIKMIKKQTFNLYVLLFVLTAELSYLKDIYYAYVHGVSL